MLIKKKNIICKKNCELGNKTQSILSIFIYYLWLTILSDYVIYSVSLWFKKIKKKSQPTSCCSIFNRETHKGKKRQMQVLGQVLCSAVEDRPSSWTKVKYENVHGLEMPWHFSRPSASNTRPLLKDNLWCNSAISLQKTKYKYWNGPPNTFF